MGNNCMLGVVTELNNNYGMLSTKEGVVYKFDYSELPRGKEGDKVYFTRLPDAGRDYWATDLEKVMKDDCCRTRCDECKPDTK